MDQKTLNKFDGRRKSRILVAYNGKIYDLSKSALWEGGTHMDTHNAGQDLTDYMPMAPHGSEKLEGFPVVGTLSAVKPGSHEETKQLQSTLTKLYNRFHFHPVSVHFPIALFIFSVVMDIFYLIMGRGPATLATTSWHAFIFATAILPITIGTGFLSWWLNYSLALTTIFKKKIAGSLLLLFLAAIVLSWRLINPEIITATGFRGWIYHTLIISIWPLIVFIGYQGGKITFPK